MDVSPRTIEWYSFDLTRFIKFASTYEVIALDYVDARLVREYLSGMEAQDLSDHYIHGHARSIRTFLKFALEEEYIEKPVKFKMPKIRKKRLPILEMGDVRKLIDACGIHRDRAIMLLALDTGLRLSEIIHLDWGDVGFKRQTLLVHNGKGGKDRVVAVGARVLQRLLKYRRQIKDSSAETDPLFQTRSRRRFTRMGLRSVFVRLAEKSGVAFSAHALRRTFAKMSVRSGRDVIYIQHWVLLNT